MAERSLPISFRGFSPFLTFKHSCSSSLFAQSPAMPSCQSHSPQISIFTSLHETQIHATGMVFPELQKGTPSAGQKSCQSHHLAVNPVCPYTSFLLIDLSILLISVYKTEISFLLSFLLSTTSSQYLKHLKERKIILGWGTQGRLQGRSGFGAGL